MSAVATIQAQPAGPSLTSRFGNRYGVDPTKVLATLRATCFNVRGVEVTNEQMMALLIVADQYKLNPFTKEIFAFPDKGGIVPVVGVDGWSRIINEHAQFDGLDFETDPEGTYCTCIIHRKDRAHPIKVTEYMAEVKRQTQPWQSHPRRMLRHKTLIQCARIAFGFAGIYDEDEAQRIIEADAAPLDAKAEKEERKTLTQAILAHADSIKAIKDGIARGDLSRASEAWAELDMEEQQSLWVAPTKGGPFTTQEREVMKTSEFRLANGNIETAVVVEAQ